MTPTVVFDTFGIVSGETNGSFPPPTSSRADRDDVHGHQLRPDDPRFPSAGSAYTYTSETMSPKLGFLIGGPHC